MATAEAATKVKATDSGVVAEPGDPGWQRAQGILQELADATLETATALVEEQKIRAAAQVGIIAAAIRAAARSFEGSGSPDAADYADRAAAQIASAAEIIRERRWGEMAAAVEDVAHRQPVLFVATAAVLGFLAGRFWTAPAQTGPDAGAPNFASAKETAARSIGGDGRLLDQPPAAGASELE